MAAMMRFEDQVAIVTGAGRGIGHAIALRLAGEGAKVAAVSRSEANAQRTVDEIAGSRPDGARAYAVDVADHEAVQATCAKILSDFGQVDVLVNNAGITRDGLSLRMSIADWDLVLDTNLRGAFSFAQGVMRSMTKRRSGRIINISSVAGLTGNPGQANYSASKAGLIGLTKTLARELASRGITVNAIAPGFITTDMTSVLSDEIRKTVLPKIPLGKFGQSDDIAAAVAFIAAPQAGYITGQVLTGDGGMVM
jgi:3-oxoacyl-[acyl-carrier protein] reductase